MRSANFLGALLGMGIGAILFADHRVIDHIEPIVHQAPGGGLDLSKARTVDELFDPGLSAAFIRDHAKPGDDFHIRAVGFPLLGYWVHDASLLRDGRVIVARRSGRPPAWTLGVALASAPLLLSLTASALFLVFKRPG
jgi:hypothetical protein